jgi:hypothetical protein
MLILPVVLLIALGLAIGAGWVVWYLIRRKDSGAREAGACRVCGYSVHGLVSWQCPECGSDLRQVGIAPAGRSNQTPAVTAGVATGLGVLFAVLVLLAVPLFLWQVRPATPSSPAAAPKPATPTVTTTPQTRPATQPATRPGP